MTFSKEQAIREALRYNDGRLLEQTVKHMSFPDYDEIERCVRETPGGYRNLSYRGVEVENVCIRNRYGRPQVEHL